MAITHILDIAIIIIFLFAILGGFFQGLICMAARVVAAILSYFLAVFAATAGNKALAEQYFIPFLQKKSAAEGWPESTIDFMAEQLAYTLIFALVFLILGILFSRLIVLLKLVDRIPVVGQVNRLGGAVVGFFGVFLLLFLMGQLFFGLVPSQILLDWGFTKKALEDTILLHSFVP